MKFNWFFILAFMCGQVFATQAPLQIKFEKSHDLISGKTIDLSHQQKKFRVFYFLNSTCPCTQAHFDHMNELQQQNPEFSFLGLHSNKSIPNEVAQHFFSKYKIDFPVIEDRDLHYANLFGANKTPHVYVLDTEGNVVYQGGVTNSRHPKKSTKFYLQEVLLALKSGGELPYKETRTLGCYINR